MKALRTGIIKLTVLTGVGLSATAAVADGMRGAGPVYQELPSIWSGLYGGAYTSARILSMIATNGSSLGRTGGFVRR